MSTCVFDKAVLRETFVDLENYLAYLKGNELAYDYLERARSEMSRNAQDGESTFVVRLEDGYQFPCPERRWAVSPDEAVRQFAVSTHVESGIDEEELQTRVARQIQGYADEAWQDGASWASGLADYLYSLCERFTEVDLTVMSDAIVDLQKEVLEELDEGANPDWAHIDHTLGQWSGDSAAEWHGFSLNYSWYKAEWGNYASYIVTGFIVAARIIDKTQRGATDYAESMRAALVDQLETWTQWHRPPEDPPEPPAWLASVEKIAGDAYDLLGEIPVVENVKGVAEKAVSVAGKVKTLAVDLGFPVEHEEEPIKVRTADELYQDITRTLQTDYDQAYWSALQEGYDGPAYGPQGKQGAFSGKKMLERLARQEHAGFWQVEHVVTTPIYDPHDDKQYS